MIALQKAPGTPTWQVINTELSESDEEVEGQEEDEASEKQDEDSPGIDEGQVREVIQNSVHGQEQIGWRINLLSSPRPKGNERSTETEPERVSVEKQAIKQNGGAVEAASIEETQNSPVKKISISSEVEKLGLRTSQVREKPF